MIARLIIYTSRIIYTIRYHMPNPYMYISNRTTHVIMYNSRIDFVYLYSFL